MYRCSDCGREFDDPATVEDARPYGEGYCYESFSVCPHCGGDYEELIECECCGEYFTEDELEDGYCEECIENTRKQIAEKIASMFTKGDFMKLPEAVFDYLIEEVENVYNETNSNEVE